MTIEDNAMTTLVVLMVIVSIISLHSMFLMAKRTTGLEIFTTMYPVVLVVCMMIGVSEINRLKGYPVNDIPKDEVMLVSHAQDGDNFVIFVKEHDGGYRLYRVKGGKENKEVIDATEKAQKEGQRYMIRMTKDEYMERELVRLDQIHPKED